MSGLSPEVAVMGLALGLVLSLVCYLATNLSPGGMITPGGWPSRSWRTPDA